MIQDMISEGIELLGDRIEIVHAKTDWKNADLLLQKGESAVSIFD